MSGYTLAFHADAVIDYDEAYYWYEDQQKGLGEKFISAIKSKTQQILDGPELFGVKGRQGYHEAFVNGFPYTIVYRIYKKKQVIFINSVHHQKKHPPQKIPAIVTALVCMSMASGGAFANVTKITK